MLVAFAIAAWSVVGGVAIAQSGGAQHSLRSPEGRSVRAS